MKAACAPKIAAVRFQGQGRACERTAERGRAPGEVPAATDTTAEDAAVAKHVESVLSAERPPRAPGAGLAAVAHEGRHPSGSPARASPRKRTPTKKTCAISAPNRATGI